MLYLLKKLAWILKEAEDPEEKGGEERHVSGTERIWLLGLVPLRLTYECTIKLRKLHG